MDLYSEKGRFFFHWERHRPPSERKVSVKVGANFVCFFLFFFRLPPRWARVAAERLASGWHCLGVLYCLADSKSRQNIAKVLFLSLLPSCILDVLCVVPLVQNSIRLNPFSKGRKEFWESYLHLKCVHFPLLYTWWMKYKHIMGHEKMHLMACVRQMLRWGYVLCAIWSVSLIFINVFCYSMLLHAHNEGPDQPAQMRKSENEPVWHLRTTLSANAIRVLFP